MGNPKLRTKPNLLKEEVLLKIRTIRRILTKVRFNATIVKYKHFVDECWFKKDQKTEESNIAHGGDPDAVLMMTATCEDKINGEEWYLDSGCSNHMTSHRDVAEECQREKSR